MSTVCFEANKAAIYAGIFSAVGSVPVQNGTLLIAIMRSAKGESALAGGGIVSASVFGIFLTTGISILFPRVTITRPILAIVVALHIMAIVSSFAADGTTLVICWFVVGLCSGIYMQLGVLVAARSQIKHYLFMTRLSAALFFAGLLPLAVAFVDISNAYLAMCAAYSVLVIGVFVFMFPYLQDLGEPERPKQFNKLASGYGRSGLFVLFIFFLGQSGFLAHSSMLFPSASQNIGFVSASVMLSKITVAAVMMALLLWLGQLIEKISISAMVLGVVLIMSSTSIDDWRTAALLLVAFQISFNMASSALMAQVATVGSERQKSGMLLTLLAGSVLGPLVAGALIDSASFHLVQLVGAASAVAALAWVFWTKRAAVG